MSQEDYTKDSKKWPQTPGKPGWQGGPIAKKKNGKKTTNIKIWDKVT